ncbi:MAG: serine/threonine-protein phosphatase [Acidobacteriia bacterium]|nr:serine/threonine-protein phosphatase [Terriglobia bacterium]
MIELAENGLFLGPFQHARDNNVSASFTPGDHFLLYTDGIIEATTPVSTNIQEDDLTVVAVHT